MKIFSDNRKDIIADMHTHSEHSHDSICKIKDMAEAQKEKGTAIFAVTDHCDVEYGDILNLEEIVGNSIKDANEQNTASDTEILRGFEIGEAIWNMRLAEKIISKNQCDVIIGSVHAVRLKDYQMPYSKIDFASLGKEKSEEYLSRYFDDLLLMLKSMEFDILAHLTCPLRYINGRYSLNVDCKKYKDKITKILELTIKNDIALEVNTSCKKSGYDEFMPEEWIIKLYKEMGGYLITLGSDAHIKKNASYCFDKAIEMLKQNGFSKLHYFKNRCIYEYEI